MNRILRFLLIWTAFFQSVPVWSQYYNLTFRNYTSSNGLSQSEVQAILEDKYGFIWIGTRFGLTRFDGKEFRTFYHHMNDPKSIGENIVNDIKQDSKGTIWLALYNSGISRMNDLNFTYTNFQVVPGRQRLLSDKVNVLTIDRNDHVWAGTESGLSVYDPVKDTFQNFIQLPDEKSVGFWVSALRTDNKGNIWLGTRLNGLYFISAPSKVFQPLMKDTLPSEINDIHIDPEGKIWVATGKGLYILTKNENDNGYSLSKAPIIFQQEVIEDIESDHNGNLWLATRRHGLLIFFIREGYLERLQENYASSRGLLSNRLSCIFRDSRNGMWVGGENGLQSFHNESQKFNIYPGLNSVSNNLRGSSIYGIYEVDNDFLLATSGGVLVYNRITNLFVPVKQNHDVGDAVIRYRSIQFESPDKWWVTSDYGIFELTKQKGYYELKRPQELSGNPIFRTESFRNYIKYGKNELWLATTVNGLIKYNYSTGELKRFYHVPGNRDSLGDNIINFLTTDKEDNLLICHDNGFSVFSKKNNVFRNYSDIKIDKINGLSSRYVYDIYDDGNKYWVATYGGGLNSIDKKNGSTKYFTSEDGLCNDAIYNIVPEGDSIFWLSTNKGLSRFDIRKNRFQNFSQNDGLPADEFNMLSKFVNSDGEIFMATINGVISFNPKQLTNSSYPPKIYLAKIRLNGRYLADSITGVVNRDRKFRAAFNEDLYLEFSPLVYTRNNTFSIRYKLNVQEQWKEAQAGTLLPLINTEPGNYQLQIQLIDNASPHSSDTWNLELEILPPYWKTAGFRASVFFVVVLLSFYFIRTYIKRRLEKQRILFEREQAVEKERSRISAELHDDIGGGLTAIRLLSEMNKDRSLDESSRVFFGKISASSNELIQKMNEIVWALNVNHDNLQSLIAYTRQYAVSYLDDFQIRCEVKLPDHIPEMPVMGNKRRNVFLLVKEALSNIVKHAHANTVNILVTIGDRLHIEVSDNGLGIDMGELRAGSHGLNNMRKRVDHLNGWLNIVNNNGTTVIIDIPLKDLTEPAGM